MKDTFPSRLLQMVIPQLKNILSKIKQLIPEGAKSTLREIWQKIPAKLHKWLLLVPVLLLILGLSCCFPKRNSGSEPLLCVVAADNLDVHKKADADSKVLGQLPHNLEIEVLEQKTVDSTVWGRIDKTELPDGANVKAGWIDLQYVRSPGDPEPEATEPVVEDEPEPETVPATMGTVITGKLNIRSGAGSQYEAVGSYLKGDRIEIIETEKVDDTIWGRTGMGWVGMGYVRMDGTAAAPADDAEEENSSKKEIISDGSLGILGYGVVDLGELNVRSGPGTEHEKVRTVQEGARYAYYQTEGDWVRIEDGWVSKQYFYMEGTIADDAVSGTVTENDLNIRTGPSTDFHSIGTYSKGDTVVILGQVHTWGYTAKGWISMSYVEEAPPTYTTGTGTVTSGLNIRQEPNADSDMVGTYKKGDFVTVLEVSGEWGRTDKGWINLAYVDYN